MTDFERFVEWAKSELPKLKHYGYDIYIVNETQFNSRRFSVNIDSEKFISTVIAFDVRVAYDFHVVDVNSERDLLNVHAACKDDVKPLLKKYFDILEVREINLENIWNKPRRHNFKSR